MKKDDEKLQQEASPEEGSAGKAGKADSGSAESKKYSDAEVDALVQKALAKEAKRYEGFEQLKAELEVLKKEKMNEQEKAVAEAREAAISSFAPKETRLKSLEETIEKLLELELVDVPEDKRDLIPGLPGPEERLAWLKKAKASGLFAPKADSTTATKPNSAGRPSEEANEIDLSKLAEEKPGDYAKALNKKFGIRVKFN